MGTYLALNIRCLNGLPPRTAYVLPLSHTQSVIANKRSDSQAVNRETAKLLKLCGPPTRFDTSSCMWQAL